MHLTVLDTLSDEDVFGVESVTAKQFEDFAYVAATKRPFQRFLDQFRRQSERTSPMRPRRAVVAVAVAVVEVG